MRSPRILAIDIGASRLAGGVFSIGASGRLVLQQFVREPLSADPAQEARWLAEVGRAFGGLVSRARLAGGCALAVPGHLALTKFVKTPSMPAEKRGNILAFEASEAIPHPLNEVVWDWQVVADDSFDLEAMLTAVKFDAMESLCAAADAAGLSVERAVPAGLALREAFRHRYPTLRESVVVADVGARSTHLLFLEGERFYFRALSLAGNSITQAIADELRIDFAAAEALKVQVLSGRSDLAPASPARAAVQRAAEAFGAKLAIEITRSTLHHRRQSGGAAPTALYLTGGGSAIGELPAWLTARLRWQVDRFDPLSGVDLSADARAGGADVEAPALASLVGLAARLLAPGAPEASLLPPAITEAMTFRKRQPWLIAAAAVATLALLPPVIYFHRLAALREAEVREIDSRLMPLRAVQTRNEDNLRQIEDAKKQIAALRGAYDTKTNWIDFFADLQTRLVKVEDVWLDRLSVDRSALPAAANGAPAPESPEPAADPATQTAAAPPALRLKLSGRLLDVANPQSRVSAESLQRVKQLLASFAGSQFVAAVENEHFDNNQNGLLRFDFTLVLGAKRNL